MSSTWEMVQYDEYMMSISTQITLREGDQVSSPAASLVGSREGLDCVSTYENRREEPGTYILVISFAAAMPTSNSPSVGSRSACLASCMAES